MGTASSVLPPFGQSGCSTCAYLPALGTLIDFSKKGGAHKATGEGLTLPAQRDWVTVALPASPVQWQVSAPRN